MKRGGLGKDEGSIEGNGRESGEERRGEKEEQRHRRWYDTRLSTGVFIPLDQWLGSVMTLESSD